MPSFVHLHVHSEYSLLDGLARLGPLAARAKALGMDALAVTDHGVMYAAVEFTKAARHNDIRPIIGCEVYVAPRSRTQRDPRLDTSPYHLVLLARNEEGYHNLIELCTAAQLEGFYYRPRVDAELLEAHAGGLVALSACLSGEVPRLLSQKKRAEAEARARWHQELYGREHYFLELQVHEGLPELPALNAELADMARRLGIPLVATNDTHYIDREDAAAQELLLCIQTNTTLSDPKRMRMAGNDYHLRSPEEMVALFAEYPGAIENTLRIAELCRFKIETHGYHLPIFEVPEGETAESYLRRLCNEGLHRRYGEPTPALQARLDHELAVIHQMGFDTYFLIVWDLVHFAKSHGILVGPGRGSAAGSLVSYCLAITELEPLAHGLIFERFLNPGRVTMPDIDLDFPDDRREELITYATQKYGQEKVAQIVTFGTMAARAAIRDAGRALGMPLGDVDRVAKLVPGGVKVTIASALEESAELRQVYESEDYLRELIDKARALEGLARHASTHAAGVVIADQPLTAYVPLALAPRGEGQVTQYSMEALESIGLLKIDFLGLSTLTVIDRCLKHIKATQGIQITPAEIPLDDPATFALLSSAEVTGVFQVESSGMRKTLREMQPTVFEDIVVLNSLYRPGPMQYIANYIARKYGREEVTYHHPAMEPILKDTYGIIVYQEQIIRMVTDLAGYSAAEADLMRRAVGKKKAKDLAEQRAKFVAGAVERGIPQDAANAIMSDIEFFANYGFNKAHSAAYSVITCQTAYLKAHYPVEYMAALLSVERGNVEKVAALIADCRRLGIPVLPPDVNHSGLDFTIEPVGQAVGRPVGRALQPAEPVGQASSPAKPVGQPVGQAVGRAFQPAEPTPEQASVVDAAGWKARPTGMAIRFGMAAIKNVGEGPVEIILQARGDRPFAGAGDFCQRVDLRQVNKRVLECLVKCGVFDCLAPRGQLLAALDHMVATSQEAHAAREAGQLSLFGGLGGGQQPAMSFLTLPEVPPVPRKDQLAWEKELLGLYVSQNPLNLLPLNLEHVTRTDQVDETIKGRRIQIMGLVASVRTIYTKKGDPMAFVQVEDLAGAVEVVVFPRTYEETRDLWAEDRLVVVKGKADVREGRASVICDAAREYDPVIDGQAGEPAPQWGGQARTAAPQARQARTLAPRSGDGEEPPIPPPGFEPGPARRNVRRLPSCLSVTFQRSGDDERDARRLGEVYRLLTATPGDVPFCFYVPSVRGRVQLEFPNAMTCYSETLRDELLARFGGDLLAVEWAS